MSTIAVYIKTLALFIILSALINVLSPSSSFKKYISFITGIMLISFMLEPFSNIVAKTDSIIDGAIINYEAIINSTELHNNAQNAENQAVSKIIDEYRKNLINQIEQTVKSHTSAQIENAEIVLNEDYNSDEFGYIYGIHLTLKSNYINDQGVISAVAFGNQTPSKQQVDENLEQTLKNSLVNVYKLKSDNIHITVR